MIARLKNATAYQTSLSAVKKTHKPKRGIEKNKEKIPKTVDNFGSFLKTRKAKTATNKISCIFTSNYL